MSGGLRTPPWPPPVKSIQKKQINYPTDGNMLFEYTGLSGCRIGASFIQPETTTNHDGRPPDSLPPALQIGEAP
jgi:hypothetical protein